MEFKNEPHTWQNTSLMDYIREGNLPYTWKDFFEREQVVKQLEIISQRIEESSKTTVVYPPPESVFLAFHLPLNKIKVVLLGQDPYHDGNAMGLCFSVRRGKNINPSLRNIYTELEREGYNVSKTGDLSHWAEQGVMMLNTALTVEKGNPESHLDVWYHFTEMVLEEIAKKTEKIVWMFMGSKAIKFAKYATGHEAIYSSHPSPLSARAPCGKHPAFIGSDIFKKVNDKLKEKIVW